MVTCTACGDKVKESDSVTHPLLDVPVCRSCREMYESGEFTLNGENEIYCRWCGEGRGQLFLCDSCPKSFCSGCVKRNFPDEVYRIESLDNRWTCFICSPQAIADLCVKNEWNSKKAKSLQSSAASGKYLICRDVSKGREKFEIPVYNEVDKVTAPLDFVYVTKPISGGAPITNNPSFISCCTCTDNCKDPKRCECALLMDGFAYNDEKVLVADKPGGIYECNSRCSCHISRCKNRVIGNGPQLPLEVFRCKDSRKGWGLRCKDDIYPGTYVADYIGEVMQESLVETRGLTKGDEYLYNIDKFGRSMACERLCDMQMKRGLAVVPKEVDMDVGTMSRESLEPYLRSDLVDRLVSSGALERARSRLRQDEAIAEANKRKMNEAVSADVAGKAAGSASVASGGGASSKSSAESAAAGGAGRKEKKLKIAVSTTGKEGGAEPTPVAPPGLTLGSLKLSWAEERQLTRVKAWREARTLITDRAVMDTEREYGAFSIDARWYGSVGRFFNHSCSPNLDIVTAFVETHDNRMTRIAFFAKDFIPKGTELCYDYGYQPGNVHNKHRDCLCEAENCRKVLY